MSLGTYFEGFFHSEVERGRGKRRSNAETGVLKSEPFGVYGA